MSLTDTRSSAGVASPGDPRHLGPTEADLALLEALRGRLTAVLKGKAAVIERVLVGLLARGHLLLEDQPGLGKTTLAKALATAVGERFARLQCTPDLLPGDVTGFSIFDQRKAEFTFQPGPVFADVLLVDEINRATPRTQSALLEAMAERQVTVDTVRRPLSETFFVIATQNPIEQHGTYPLPEAQLDRFAMKLSIGYPAAEHEIAMLGAAIRGHHDGPSTEMTSLCTGDTLARMQDRVQAVDVAEHVRGYLVTIAEATRQHPRIHLGISPRGLLTWQRCAQAVAFLDGRSYVTPDDAQDIAVEVLGVRLGVEGADAEGVIRDLLRSTPVPAGPGGKRRAS